MPCYTIKKTTVAVDKMDLLILANGLKSAGFAVTTEGTELIFSRNGRFHGYRDGQLELSGTNAEDLAAEIKRAYSTQIVKQMASKFGWQLSAKPQTNEFVATKRR